MSRRQRSAPWVFSSYNQKAVRSQETGTQSVPFEFADFQRRHVPSHAQSLKCVHRPGVRCACVLHKWLWFLYFAMQYRVKYSRTLSLFPAQDVWKQAEKQYWCSRWSYPWLQASPYTVLLYFPRCWTVRFKSFSLFFMYYSRRVL